MNRLFIHHSDALPAPLWGIILNKAAMERIELDRLALQIEQLLQAVADLRVENQCLRNQLARHAREKSLWHENNRQTAGKIKKIISRLQEALI